MPRGRRSTLLLTVAALTIPVALSACASNGAFKSGMRSPTGGATEPVRQASKVDAARLLRIAQATEAAGDLANAAAMYQRASSLDPDSMEALLALAKIYRKLGVPENAAQTFGSVIARQPDNLDARRGLGNSLIALNHPREALDQFEHMIVADPLDPRGYDGRGVALSMQGRFDEARASFETGLKLAPEDIQINNNLAHSLVMAGRAAEALPILKKLSSLPNVPDRVRENLALAERHVAENASMSELGPPTNSPAKDVPHAASETTESMQVSSNRPLPVTTETIDPPNATSDQVMAAATENKTEPEIASNQAVATVTSGKIPSVMATQPTMEIASPAPTVIPVDTMNAVAPAAGSLVVPNLVGIAPSDATPDAPTAVSATTSAQPIAPVANPEEAITSSTRPSSIADMLRTTGPWSEPAGGFIITRSDATIRTTTTKIPSAEIAAAAAPARATGSQAPDITASMPLNLVAPASGDGQSTLVNIHRRYDWHEHFAPIEIAIDETTLRDVAPAAGLPAIKSNPATAAATPIAGEPVTRRYRVYLAPSVYSKLAQDRAVHLTHAAPELLGGLVPQVVSIEGKEPATHYSLRSEPQMSEEDASELCESLVSREIPCFVSLLPVEGSSETSEADHLAPPTGDDASSTETMKAGGE